MLPASKEYAFCLNIFLETNAPLYCIYKPMIRNSIFFLRCDVYFKFWKKVSLPLHLLCFIHASSIQRICFLFEYFFGDECTTILHLLTNDKKARSFFYIVMCILSFGNEFHYLYIYFVFSMLLASKEYAFFLNIFFKTNSPFYCIYKPMIRKPVLFSTF